MHRPESLPWGSVLPGPSSTSFLDYGGNRLRRRSSERDLRSSTGGMSDSDKVKAKLKSAWNNIKYGWKVHKQASFKKDAPIWLLGKLYHVSGEDATEWFDDTVGRDIKDFLADFTSRIWLTYRTGFVEIDGSSIRSDCGWGCMLRTGQMMLAQTLVVLMLGREWIRHAAHEWDSRALHREILSWFLDTPAQPFSIHRLVEAGRRMGHSKIGDWYGPGMTACILKSVIERSGDLLSRNLNLVTYVAQDCTVCIEEVDELCCGDRPRSSSLSSSKSHDCGQANNIFCMDPAAHQHDRTLRSATEPPPSSMDISNCTMICNPGRLRREDSLQLRSCDSWTTVGDKSYGGQKSLGDTWCFPDMTAESRGLSNHHQRHHSPSSKDATISSHLATNGMSQEHYRHSVESVPIPPDCAIQDRWESALLLLIPLRLGAASLNPLYIPLIKTVLSLPYSVGIMGGKPKHSLYFVGWHEDHLLYLDPHVCQDVVDVTQGDHNIKSFHCSHPKKLSFDNMDPSCTLGFVFEHRKQFQDFLHDTETLLQSTTIGCYPLFSVIAKREASSRCLALVQHQQSLSQSGELRPTGTTVTRKGESVISLEDDFVILH